MSSNHPKHSPAPAVMPVDREAWRRELHLSNFVNTYYQYRDLQRVQPCRSVLIVGPGQGLDTHVLKWRGYEITTFDIDPVFNPDWIGSVHDMHMFADRQFDAVIASHVLEHLPEPYLNPALAELARVAAYALVYLPVAGRHSQVRFLPGVKGIDWSVVLDLFNYFERPNGEAKYCQQQHYWEVGRPGYRVRDLKRRFSTFFEILDHYRNRDWTPSYNFVFRSRKHSANPVE
jgi:SAM-dependent methyltransferase